MKTVFADTNYWVAIINPLDQMHEQAKEMEQQIGPVGIPTTEPVLVEVFNYSVPIKSFCGSRPPRLCDG